MIERYTLPEMAEVWSPRRKLEAWKQVEVLALEGWEQVGDVPPGTADDVRSAPCPTPEEVARREQVTNHDVAAFVDLLAGSSPGDSGRWVHYGLTSSDVLDTAGGLLLAESAGLILERTRRLLDVAIARAFEHRQTPMIGRTHGIWAEPTLFGLKVAGWAFELERARARMARARDEVAVGKLSGAVGTYAQVPPQVEAHVCAALGLSIEPASTQVTARDRHAAYLSAIALLGASMERIATEVRHLQRSEVSEVREHFAEGQKGSSAMPHKRNPITAERVTGMARLLRGYAQVGLENVALWHERDISHSSAERIALPDASTAVHYMLVRLADLIERLEVDSARMKANLESTNGLVFSQPVLLAMVDGGLDRDHAYRIVQKHAMRAWEGEGSLRDLIAEDPEAGLDEDQLDRCFSLDRVTKSAEPVFRRLEGLRAGLQDDPAATS